MGRSTVVEHRENDSQLTRDLVELHVTLNNGGEHWTQGAYHATRDGVKCHCLIGGVNIVAPEGARRSDVVEQLYATLEAEGEVVSADYRMRLSGSGAGERIKVRRRDRVSSKTSRLISWNDYWARTWSEVDRMIRKSITASRRAK